MASIAITDPGRDQSEFDRYAAWVGRWMPGTGIVRLAHASANRAALAACDGLMLSGGADVHPRHYGRMDALDAIGRIDEERDEFEFRVIEESRATEMPVLGICRGTQIFSVALGGTLIPDIERIGLPSHRKDGTVDRVHTVAVDPGSTLHAIVGCVGGDVNSSHHQAVDTPEKGSSSPSDRKTAWRKLLNGRHRGTDRSSCWFSGTPSGCRTRGARSRARSCSGLRWKWAASPASDTRDGLCFTITTINQYTLKGAL